MGKGGGRALVCVLPPHIFQCQNCIFLSYFRTMLKMWSMKFKNHHVSDLNAVLWIGCKVSAVAIPLVGGAWEPTIPMILMEVPELTVKPLSMNFEPKKSRFWNLHNCWFIFSPFPSLFSVEKTTIFVPGLRKSFLSVCWPIRHRKSGFWQKKVFNESAIIQALVIPKSAQN